MTSKRLEDPQEELTRLRQRLNEAEDMLDAIRAGEVDAVVIDRSDGHQVYTLESPDQPFRIFVEQMQEGALTLNRDGTIIYCNNFFSQMVGRPEEQVRGQPFANFVEETTGLYALMEAASTGVVRAEASLRGSNSRIPVQLAFNPLPSEATPMLGLVVSDLTERERAKRLESARVTAEEARNARDKFLAIVSHELRNPLNAMLGWIQLLSRRQDCPPSVQHGLQIIERNAQAQSQLIEDLLDVSRALAGKLRLEMGPVELAEAVKNAISTVLPDADQKNVKIIQEFDDRDAFIVRGDPNRLQQIVANLLSNAIKFTPEQGEIFVTMHAVDGQAQVRVRDTGIGISADFLPNLFTLFQQNEESATTRRNGGLGLGLAIVKELVELHEGEVIAESEGEGQGATFTVWLPLVEMDVVAREEPSVNRQASLPPLDGIRVLLVEDDDTARTILSMMLAESRAQFTAVATAFEALLSLEQQPVDVLVSDIGLPDMDGYELVRRIRSKGYSGRQLPAIAVTAFASREDRRQAMLSGYQVHLSKPVDQDELVSMIANLAGSTAPTDR